MKRIKEVFILHCSAKPKNWKIKFTCPRIWLGCNKKERLFFVAHVLWWTWTICAVFWWFLQNNGPKKPNLVWWIKVDFFSVSKPHGDVPKICEQWSFLYFFFVWQNSIAKVVGWPHSWKALQVCAVVVAL